MSTMKSRQMYWNDRLIAIVSRFFHLHRCMYRLPPCDLIALNRWWPPCVMDCRQHVDSSNEFMLVLWIERCGRIVVVVVVVEPAFRLCIVCFSGRRRKKSKFLLFPLIVLSVRLSFRVVIDSCFVNLSFFLFYWIKKLYLFWKKRGEKGRELKSSQKRPVRIRFPIE